MCVPVCVCVGRLLQSNNKQKYTNGPNYCQFFSLSSYLVWFSLVCVCAPIFLNYNSYLTFTPQATQKPSYSLSRTLTSALAYLLMQKMFGGYLHRRARYSTFDSPLPHLRLWFCREMVFFFFFGQLLSLFCFFLVCRRAKKATASNFPH